MGKKNPLIWTTARKTTRQWALTHCLPITKEVVVVLWIAQQLSSLSLIDPLRDPPSKSPPTSVPPDNRSHNLGAQASNNLAECSNPKPSLRPDPNNNSNNALLPSRTLLAIVKANKFLRTSPYSSSAQQPSNSGNNPRCLPLPRSTIDRAHKFSLVPRPCSESSKYSNPLQQWPLLKSQACRNFVSKDKHRNLVTKSQLRSQSKQPRVRSKSVMEFPPRMTSSISTVATQTT
jgi:hypothetical protein